MTYMKLSIIIPCFKVEEYIEDCLYSIINQIQDGIEVILVDDGSPDNCPRICDDFSKRYSYIQVIHKKNGGLSSARNAGLRVATGDYVWFVDSDDWIMPNALDILLGYLSLKQEVDVYSSPLSYYDGAKFMKKDFNPDFCKMTGMEYYKRGYPTGAVPRFIISRCFLEYYDISFFEGILHEDGPFSILLAGCANTIITIPQSLYCYRQREESIMHSLTIKSSYDLISGYKTLQSKINNDNRIKNAQWMLDCSIKLLYEAYFFTSHLFNTKEFKQFEKDNRQFIIKELKKALRWKRSKGRLLCILFILFPKITTYIYLKYQ